MVRLFAVAAACGLPESALADIKLDSAEITRILPPAALPAAEIQSAALLNRLYTVEETAGLGLAANDVVNKVLGIAGVQDVWSAAHGGKNVYIMAVATMKALVSVNLLRPKA